MQRIGKGAFSKAFKISDTEVELRSVCPAKLAYALFAQDNKFAPKIAVKGKDRYHMPLYEITSDLSTVLNSKSMRLYHRLSSIFGTKYKGFIEAVWSFEGVSDEDKQALEDLATAASMLIHPEDLIFEICGNNVTHVNGNLVLLDCFYSARLLNEVCETVGHPIPEP